MKKDVFWNSLGVSAWSFLSLFLLVVVTRINGIAESGLFSFAFAFALIIFTICCYGGRAYQVSDHNNSFSANDYISLRILTSVAALLLTTIFIIVNSYDSEKTLLIVILVIHRIFDAIADVFYGIMQKKHRLYLAGKSMFYKSIFSALAFLGVDLLTNNLLLSSLTLPIISLLFVLLYDIPRSRTVADFTLRPNFRAMKRILKSTFLPFSIAAMGLVFANIARYFIDIYHPELQGYFGIIIMPLSLIILLFSFISTPAILHLSDKYNGKEFRALRKVITTIFSLTLIASLLLSVLMYFLGIPLLKILFDVDFSAYSIDIVLIVLIGFALSVTSLFTNVAIIARKLQPTALVYLLSNLLLALLCIALVSHLEIHGAIIAYIVASFIQTIVMGIFYLKLTHTHSASKNS